MSRLRPLWAVLATAGLVGPVHSLVAQARGDTVDIVVAATTDVHGRLRGWNYYNDAPDPARGLSRAATIVDSLRAGAPKRVLLVDAGDLLEGNPLAYVAARIDTAGPHPVIAAMNAMHYDASVIGNHEFNYGLPLLRRAIGQAAFPFLAANAYTPSARHAFRSYTIVRRAGVPIGIVGATTPGSNLWDHDNLHGRLVIRDIVPSVRAAVAAARRAGAAVVIVLLHSGLDEPASYDTVATHLPSENVAARVAHEVRGIDLIVYGHSHQQMADTTIAGVLLMQPKNYATSVGVAHLVVRHASARWQVARKWSALVRCAGHGESPAVLVATDRVHQATVRYVTTPIGSTDVVWRADSARVRDTPLIDFVLDVERRTAHSDLASTAAFSLDATIDSGPVTIAEIARLYPYDNTLESVRITGRQLRAYLEFSARYFGTAGTNEPPVNPDVPGYNFDIVSGADYTIDLSQPVGSRITRLEVHGRPVSDTDTFTMALNNYRLSGGGGYAMLRGAPVVYASQREIRDLLIDAVRKQHHLDPAAVQQHNWEIVPAVAVARAYAAMHAREPGARIRVPARPSPEPPRIPVPIRRPDNLRAAGPRLRIIATNDFHGALEPIVDSGRARHGGAAAMTRVIEHAEHTCVAPCVSILVDAGDLFQGSAASNVAFGRPVVALYDTLGYAAAAIGNHEFDWGIDTLRARMAQARFGMFAANVRTADGGRPDWARSDTIVERGPFRVGIIGVIGPETYTSIMARNVASLRFADPVPIVDSLARDLRARGADVVIVLAHSGAFCDGQSAADACHGDIIDFANRLAEPVDAIVSGHTHSLVDTDVRDIPIVQARSSGRAVAVIDLVPHAKGDRSAVLGADVIETTGTSDPSDPVVDSLVADAESSVRALVTRRVARLAHALSRTGDQYALGNLIADAQRDAGHADLAVMNNGGIRAGLPAGDVTYGDLFTVQPFGNALRKLTVPGSALRDYLEGLVEGPSPRVHVSGATLAYDTTRASGARLAGVRFTDGRTLRDDASYTIVLNEYMATGQAAHGLVTAATSDETLPVSDLDALIAWLRSRPQPLAAPAEPRIVVR